MRYDLKTPCKNCPFRNDETRIVFSCRERAEEIEEQAYRQGFPCHLSAEHREDGDDSGGFYATEDSQHCIGFIIMTLHGGENTWPGLVDPDTGEMNCEWLGEKLAEQVDWDAPVFETAEDFFQSQGADMTGKPGKEAAE